MANNNHLYSDRETRLNTLIGRVTEASVGSNYEHWRTLQQAKAEHDNLRISQGLDFELGAFANWLETIYGIRLQKEEGMIGPMFDIVDEQKYLVYKLKFV
jgi:hypothetical protein